MKEIVLKSLKENNGEYVSGQALSEMMGISRTAVWKYICELRNDGYMIESSSKKGYKLVLSPDTPNAFEVGYHLNTKILGRKIYYFDEIDSTSLYAKRIAAEGCEDGTIVIADRQTAGKGRMGRHWSSEPHLGIWMSVVLRPTVLPEEVQIITLAASVAVVRALKNTVGITAGIKWPNDIILDGKKVCGILTEMSAEMEQINYLVLGIGMNVNHGLEDFPGELSGVATSLKLFAQKNVSASSPNFNRSQIVKSFLVEMEKIYEKINQRRVQEIVQEWKGYSVTLGKNVVISVRNSSYTGIARDITEDGKLVVSCTDGIVREVLSGEVSVRGTLGYV